MSPVRGFMRKEVLHLLRDRQTLSILILFPVLQVIIFGYAVRTDVRSIPVTVVDSRPGPASHALINRLAASEVFELVAVERSSVPLERQLRDGSIRQALVLPADLDRRLARGDKVIAGLVTDASDPNTSQMMQGYATAMLAGWYRENVGAGQAPSVELLTRMRFNPSLASVNLFVPGLIAFVLTIVSALMTAVALTREKEVGTMEMLLVSPLRPWQIVIGKVAPYVALGLINALMVFVAARLVFNVPVRGSLTLLALSCLLYTVVALAIGIVISTVATTQRAAQMAALAGMLLPTMMLSGFIFPIAAMPDPLQLLSNSVPARWFLAILRGVMLTGAGLHELWQELAVLAVMAVVLLSIGIRRLAERL